MCQVGLTTECSNLAREEVISFSHVVVIHVDGILGVLLAGLCWLFIRDGFQENPAEQSLSLGFRLVYRFAKAVLHW